jgi:ADP-heptose:LPS heptosyltransferase
MKKILVSLLVNVGDVIMMTSALDIIRRHYAPQGGSHIAVLARPEAVELLDGSPVVDEIIVYPYRSGSMLAGLGELRQRIRAGGFDMFLSLDRRPRGAAAAVISGIRERVGPNLLFPNSRPKWWTGFAFTKTVRLTPEECAGSYMEMFQLVVRRGLGAEGQGRVSLPPVTPERDRRAAEFLGETSGKPVVGLCVRTNDPGKTWPAAAFVHLMRRLDRDLGAFMYVTGGPGDREYVEALLEEAPAGVVNLAGKTALMDIPALVGRSQLCVALDNGAAHLMANSGLENLICVLQATKPESVIDSMPQARFFRFAVEARSESVLIGEADSVFQTASELIGVASRRL